jgi:hypothetical protein
MHLDVRIPIGLMFSIFGAILTVFGKLSDPKLYEHSLGININFKWGLVLLAFGLVMLFFGLRGRKRAAAEKALEKKA